MRNQRFNNGENWGKDIMNKMLKWLDAPHGSGTRKSINCWLPARTCTEKSVSSLRGLVGRIRNYTVGIAITIFLTCLPAISGPGGFEVPKTTNWSRVAIGSGCELYVRFHNYNTCSQTQWMVVNNNPYEVFAAVVDKRIHLVTGEVEPRSDEGEYIKANNKMVFISDPACTGIVDRIEVTLQVREENREQASSSKSAGSKVSRQAPTPNPLEKLVAATGNPLLPNTAVSSGNPLERMKADLNSLEKKRPAENPLEKTARLKREQDERDRQAEAKRQEQIRIVEAREQARRTAEARAQREEEERAEAEDEELAEAGQARADKGSAEDQVSDSDLREMMGKVHSILSGPLTDTPGYKKGADYYNKTVGKSQGSRSSESSSKGHSESWSDLYTGSSARGKR
jgi:hypothetical protein